MRLTTFFDNAVYLAHGTQLLSNRTSWRRFTLAWQTTATIGVTISITITTMAKWGCSLDADTTSYFESLILEVDS